MKTLKTVKVAAAATIASSILMANACPVFAQENVREESIVETTNLSKVVLTYNANGGNANSVPKAQSANQEAIITISGAQPKREGYVFMGWSQNPAADPEGGLIHGGDSYILNQNTTLFAIWKNVKQETVVEVTEETETSASNEVNEEEVEIYQVMFNPQGGAINYDSVESDELGNVVLPEEPPIKFGVNFMGWSTDPESSEVAYQPGDALIITGDLKLYAVWQQVQPVVNPQVMFNPQGGTLSYDHVDSDELGNVVLPAEAPVKEGNKFLGWSTDPESGEVAYQPGDAFTISNDLKLYAVWQQVQPEIHVTLYFDPNGGVGGPTSIASNADGSVTISTLIPVKNGYKFMGWATNAKAGKAEYGINTTLKLTSDLKLYAVWQADSKVNTGVENNTIMYVVAGGIAAFAAGALYLLKRKEN